MRRTIPVAATLLVVTLSAALLAGDNWPHWRGPGLEGSSKEPALVRTWSPTTNIAWKLPLPSLTGSTPLIWADRIFLTVANEEFTGDLEFWAVDRNKQTVVWKKPLGSGNSSGRTRSGSSPSPVTDGRTVWVPTGTGIIKAFDFAGNEKWTRDIQKDYGLGSGDVSSPLLLDDDLIVQVVRGLTIDDPSFVVRIDGATGQTEWKVARPANAGANYHLIAPTVWKGIVIAPARVQPMLALGISTPVTDGSLLYTVRDNGAAFALDLESGAVVYGPERLPTGTYSGPPVLADGHIYVTNEAGLTSVYRAGSKFELVAQNALDDDCVSSMAISEGQIFVRTSKHLWAIGDRKK